MERFTLCLTLSTAICTIISAQYCSNYGCCPGQDDDCGPGGCLCDEHCLIAVDCCSDYVSFCGAGYNTTNTTVVTTISTTTVVPIIPCVDYTEIKEPHRSTAFQPSPTDELICDNELTEGWYRFTAHVGGMLPEGCVAPNHCGTHVPMWMNGQHPVDNQTVDRDVCLNYGTPTNCSCNSRIPIKVKKCNDSVGETYFVYNLKPTHGCQVAYCAGDGIPCPSGLVWRDSTDQCVGEPPQIAEDPILNPPVIDKTTWKVTFTCEVKYNSNTDDNSRFAVKFLFDHEEYTEVNEATKEPLTASNKRIKLDAKFLGRYTVQGKNVWSSKMGKMVSCVVQSYWKGYPDVKSREFHSNGYFAGIMATEHHLNLPEGSDFRNLQLFTTVPFICDDNPVWHENSCHIDIKLKVGNDVSTGTAGVDNCVIQIPAVNWNSTANRAYATPKKIYGVQDMQIDGDKIVAVQFQAISSGFFYHDQEVDFVPYIYGGYAPGDIQVRTIDGGAMGRCRGVTDPHYTTFDYRYYTILILGEFVFTRVTSRTFEIQVRTWWCGTYSNVVCHCAAAIREGNDVIIVDICHVGWGNHQSAYPKITEKTADGGPLSPGVSMYRDPSNKKFSINLPSGASVQVDINYWGLDVHAYLPASDRHHTEGLCGTWDGNQGNDFTKRDGTTTTDYNAFGNSWKIDRGASLFDVDCPTEDHNAPAAVLSCSCGAGNNIECGYSQNTRRNVLVGTNTATTIPKSSRNRNCGNNVKRKKRSPEAKVLYSDDIEESDGYVFDYGDNQPPPPAVEWPTATLQITEEKAVSVCREAITNSSVAAPCSALGVDIFKPVDACVEDIQFTEDFSITVAHVETMKADCTAVAFQNVSLHDKGDDGDPVPPAAIVENLCPADCSQQGQCVNGTCDCFDGFTSADCSQVEGSPPQVWFIPNNGLCDIRLRPCQKTSVIADGLIESSNLTCRVRHVELRDGNTTVILDSDELTNASLKSFREVTCELPRSPVLLGTPDETEGTAVYGFYISVSNDGVYFSDELLFTIYDSVCQNCTVGPKCFWKENTCKIRGFCFADGDPNPNNWCQQCLAQLSNHTFTERPVNLPPTFTTPTPITRVIKENLSLAIAADDPEGRPIKFSFPSDQTPTISLQDFGELKWTADERAENVTAILMVTDECGASTTQNFAFAITTCPCQNNGTCIPDPGMPRGQGHYMCDCPGYTGRWCEEEIDECQSNPCNNGTCEDLVNMFSCMCDDLHVGEFCHIDIGDHCGLQPCFPGVLCTNMIDGFECGDCPGGYVGNGTDCKDVDECASNVTNNCVHACRNIPGSFECTCPVGFLLIADQCFDIDECTLGLAGCSHLCTNTNGSYNCHCPDGFILEADNKECSELNECNSSPCQNGGQCLDGINAFSCSCPLGWLGSLCDIDIDECVVTNHGCQHGCENTPGSYTCRCPAGYKLRDDGKTCEEINSCASNPCENGATCHDNVSNYTCECQQGWDGQYCEHDTNECSSNPCKNGAICHDGRNSYTCECASGWEGQQCQNTTATSQAAFSASSETTTTAARTTDLTYLAGKPERARRILPAVLTINNTFLPQYNDKTSVEYIALSQKVIKSLTTLYERIRGFVRIILIHFKPGSIMVTYVTMFEASESVSDSVIQVTAQRNLQQAVRSGTFDESLDVQHLRHVTLTDEDLQQMYQDPDVCSLSCGEGGMCELTEKYPGVIVAECVCEVNYCISGSCTIDFEEGPKCSCPSGDGSWYGGERCQMTLSNSVVIGIAVGFCCAALIVITLLIVCMMKRRNAFKVKERDATRFGPGGLVLDNVTYGISPPRAISVVRPSVDRQTSSKSQWRPSVKNIPATQIKIPRPHVICNSFPRQGNRTIKTSKV